MVKILNPDEKVQQDPYQQQTQDSSLQQYFPSSPPIQQHLQVNQSLPQPQPPPPQPQQQIQHQAIITQPQHLPIPSLKQEIQSFYQQHQQYEQQQQQQQQLHNSFFQTSPQQQQQQQQQQTQMHLPIQQQQKQSGQIQLVQNFQSNQNQQQLQLHDLGDMCNQIIDIQPLQQQQQQQQQQQAHQSLGQEQQMPLFSTQASVQYRHVTQESGRGGGGGGSQPIYVPSEMRCIGAENYIPPWGSSEDNECSPKRLRVDKSPLPDPPVMTYPDRKKFEGEFNFSVEIPGTGNKLIVKPGEDVRTIHTEWTLPFTISLSHEHRSDMSDLKHRFLLVYSKDSEAADPVYPCLNHQDRAHPEHMLKVMVDGSEVKGRKVDWLTHPHPSILVKTPPSATGKYTYQLLFHCRNSCRNRKNLMLICQLEVDGVVVGREVFQVKVSACPRRDAGGKVSLTPAQAQTPAPDHSSPQPEEGEILANIRAEARKTARRVYMEEYFKDNFPDEYIKALETFDQLYDVN